VTLQQGSYELWLFDDIEDAHVWARCPALRMLMRSAWVMGSLAAAPCQRTAVALSGVDGHRRPVPTPVVVVPEPFPLPGAVGRTRGGRQSATPAAPVAARPGRGDLAGVGVIEVVDAEAGRRALAAGVFAAPVAGRCGRGATPGPAAYAAWTRHGRSARIGPAAALARSPT